MRKIYVIDPSGVIIGCYPQEEKAELVGSLVHALSMFSKEILRMEISEVRMGHYYMLIGKTKKDLRVAIISPVKEKQLLERAVNELDVSFKDVEITPGLVTDDITKIAEESLKRVFEEIPPMDIIDKIINYALETPRKAPPSWIGHCRDLIKKATMDFEKKIRSALKRRKISERYLRMTIHRLLVRDFVGAWKAALKSGSKVAILHTSISLARVNPRIDGLFLRKYIDSVEDDLMRRYIELRYKSFIDLNPHYHMTFKEIAELSNKLLERAEADDECLILYLPLSMARPKRLEEMLPLEERLSHDFYMYYAKLKHEAEAHRESTEALKKFAGLCREFYMDLAKKISYKSPVYLLLIANTLGGILTIVEMSENSQIFAREFLESITPFIDNIIRSLIHNAWKRISIHQIMALFTSMIELAIMSGDESLKSRVLSMLNRARNIILRTIAYIILRKKINIFVLGYIALLTALAPLLGDDELTSILFFSHPIISHEDLEKLMLNRPEHGIGISTLLHIGSLMYKKYYLNRDIERPALEIAELGIEEIERRVGEEETRVSRWLLRKLSD